jgi:hypothetical protein
MQTMLIQGGSRTSNKSIPLFSADTLFWSHDFIWFNQEASTVCSMLRICYCCGVTSAHGHTSIKTSIHLDMKNVIYSVYEFRHSDCICV